MPGSNTIFGCVCTSALYIYIVHYHGNHIFKHIFLRFGKGYHENVLYIS